MLALVRDLWGGWTTGERLPPRRFAIVTAALWLILIPSLMILTILGAASVSFTGLRAIFGPLTVASVLLWAAAIFNITVKRGRDIGIPGFVTGIVFVLLLFIGGLSIFGSILLALVPADLIARGAPER